MRAFLIAGDGRFFLDETRRFKRFLQREVGMEDVQLIKTAYMTLGHVWTCLCKALDPNQANGPLLLLYCGHGAEDGWGVNFRNTLLYRVLVSKLLKDYPQPIMFINDCCYAAAPIEWFDQFGIAKKKISFVAASSHKATTAAGLVRRVQKSWQRQEVHQASFCKVVIVDLHTITEGEEITPEMRWGAKLDYLFFSKFPWDPKKDRIRITGKEVVTVPESWIINGIPCRVTVKKARG